MNYLDWFLVILLAWGCWRGFKNGAIKAFSGLIAYVLGVLAALNYAGAAQQMLGEKLNLKAVFSGWLSGILPLPAELEAEPVSTLSAAEIDGLLADLPLPVAFQEQIKDLLAEVPAGFSLVEVISLFLAEKIIYALGFIVVLLVVVIGIKLAAALLTKGIHLTPLGIFNRMGGLVVGLLVNVLVLGLLCLLLSPLFFTFGMDPEHFLYGLGQQFQDSVVASYLIETLEKLSSMVLKETEFGA